MVNFRRILRVLNAGFTFHKFKDLENNFHLLHIGIRKNQFHQFLDHIYGFEPQLLSKSLKAVTVTVQYVGFIKQILTNYK